MCDFDHNTDLVLEKIEFTCPGGVPSTVRRVFNTPHNRYVLESLLEAADPSCLKSSLKLGQKRVDEYLKVLMIHHLKHHVHARLTKTQYGVGVIAIRDIPANTPVFDNTLGSCFSYNPVEISDADVAENGLEHCSEVLKDFFLASGSVYPVPVLGPNAIDISFYLNHSDRENLSTQFLDDCDMSVYVTNRLVRKGEELTINYLKFKLPHDQMKTQWPWLFPQNTANTAKAMVTKRKVPSPAMVAQQDACGQASSRNSRNNSNESNNSNPVCSLKKNKASRLQGGKTRI